MSCCVTVFVVPEIPLKHWEELHTQQQNVTSQKAESSVEPCYKVTET
jgi:hypothetical protein